MIDALIISDIHLGSDNCHAKELCEFLEGVDGRTSKLILNGDVFDSIDFRRLKKHHWQILSKIRKLSDHLEVIWIAGNHDGPAEIISHLLGVAVVKEYILSTGSKKVMIFHGDKYDKFITDRPILTWLGDTIYSILQKLDKSHYWARLAKHSSKQYLHCAERVKLKSIQYASENECGMVCCGHTHHATAEYPYYNSGCWTEKPCTYLEVDQGVIRLVEFNPIVHP